MRTFTRTICLTVAALGLTATAGPSLAQVRTWSDEAGLNRIEAEFAGVEEGQVKLRLPSGEIRSTPLKSLSQEDRNYIKSFAGLAPSSRDIEGDDRFSQALREAPHQPENWIVRGVNRLSAGEHEAALQDFEQALKLDPQNALAYDARGSAYAKMGEAEKAHQDFNKAIELDPNLPSAYRHRADNLRTYAQTEEGKEEFGDRAADYRKKLYFADKSNRRKTAWQPLNHTTGNVSRPAVVAHLAELDYERYRQLEGELGLGGWGNVGGGVHFGGGYGVSIGGPGVQVVVPGQAPQTVVLGEGDPAVGVYPATVSQGETITLVANPAEMQKAMPVKLEPGQRLKRGEEPPREPVKQVDFYRDVNGNGVFDKGIDQLVGTDYTPTDGFSTEVNTSQFPVGKQNYFALPKGAEGSGTPVDVTATVDSLKKAAEEQRKIAQQAQEAAEQAGLTAEQAESLRKQQEQVTESAKSAYEQLKQGAPEAAKPLAESATPMKAVGNRLAAAKGSPGEASKEAARDAGERAELAAKKLEEAAAKLEEQGNDPDAQYAQGTPASGAGEITPPKNQTAAAPGPGPGAPGPGTPGGYGPGDRDVNIYEDGDDINVYRDDDDAAVAIRDALRYIDDDDYDRAVVAVEDYDRLITEDPNRYVYLRDRADTYLTHGNYDYAVRDYDRLIVQRPADAWLYYNRGCSYMALGNLDLALADFTKSVELNETWNLAYNNRGSVLARLGKYELAIADFNRAIELDANDRLAYRNRSLAYKLLGRTAEAEADMSRFRQLEAAQN